MPYHHTELIRLLEQRGYIFPSDPASITEILRQADGTPEAKLHRRAQLIDRAQAIAQIRSDLQRYDNCEQELAELAAAEAGQGDEDTENDIWATILEIAQANCDTF